MKIKDTNRITPQDKISSRNPFASEIIVGIREKARSRMQIATTPHWDWMIDPAPVIARTVPPKLHF